MSDWSPPPRPGFTKTGKSLKAVRRYYALKDASKRKRSPDANEEREEERVNREDKGQPPPASKRRRSPNDDKLSKRIAAELKVQQEANEKRTRQLQQSLNLQPTERSALPFNITPRETGPTFVTEPQPPKSVKSAKSAKSNKSIDTSGFEDYNPRAVGDATDLSFTSIGCILTCLMLALVYIVTWMLMLSIDLSKKKVENSKQVGYNPIASIRWLAIASLVVLITVPYWLLCRKRFGHAAITLVLMIASTINLIVYLIYSIMIEEKPINNKQEHPEFMFNRIPLNFWLGIIYFLFHIIADGLMIKQIFQSASSKPADVRLSDTQMSQYLAPR